MDIICDICSKETPYYPAKTNDNAPDICFECLKRIRDGYRPYLNDIPTGASCESISPKPKASVEELEDRIRLLEEKEELRAKAVQHKMEMIKYGLL